MLTERNLADGKKFITGVWRVDYLVNFFSNDLAHIPAGDFKDEDGNDFSSLLFDFRADGTVIFSEPQRKINERGVWNQTDIFEYEWKFDILNDLPRGQFLKNAEKLSVYEGDLVFSVGFLTVALKKQE